MNQQTQLLPRTPGRPVHKEGASAREALIDAAVTLFSRQWVAATPTRAIAHQSGVTPAMVQYYFSSREKLLEAVFEERISRFIDCVFTGFPAVNRPVNEVIAALVDRMFAAVERMPWMPSVWIRDIVSEGGAFWERMLNHLQERMTRPLSDAGMAELLERFQAAHRANELTGAIVPGLILISSIGLVMFPLATRGFWSNLPGMAVLSREDVHRHAQALLAQGVTKQPDRAQSVEGGDT